MLARNDYASPERVLTPAQLRAARALVDWSRETLANESGVGHNTTKDFENRGTNPTLRTVQRWMRALEKAGVVFLNSNDTEGPGVRLRKDVAERMAPAEASGKPKR